MDWTHRPPHTTTEPPQHGGPNRPPGSMPLLQCALPTTFLPRFRPGSAWSQPEPAPPCSYLHMTDVPPGRPMRAGAAGPDPRAGMAANGLTRGGPGLRGRPRGKRGRGGGRRGGGRGARSSGGAGRRRWFGAGLARSGRTHARWSVCPPGAGGRPGPEPRAREAGRRCRLPGRAGPEPLPAGAAREGGRERARELGREGGRPRARAPRPAPPAPPAGLAREEGEGGGGADGPSAARPVTAPARAGGRGGAGAL